jgi:hypothetical protein
MNFDGSSSTASNGNVDTLNATSKITLVGKYTLPTDLPIIANEVIQSTGNTLPDGSMETIWTVAEGLGDVSSSTNISTDGEIAVFNATSGKIIKNSNTTFSSLLKNPAQIDLNMNNLNIDNVEILNLKTLNIDNVEGTYVVDVSAPIQEVLSVSNNTASVSGATITQKIKTRGTVATPLAVLAGDVLSLDAYSGHNGTSISAGASIQVEATENATINASGSKMTLSTVNTGEVASTPKIIIDDDVDIGVWKFQGNGALNYTDSTGFAQGRTLFSQNSGAIALNRFSDSFEPQISFARSRGDFTIQTPIQAGDSMGRLYFQGNDGVSNQISAMIDVTASQLHDPTSRGTRIQFKTTDDSTANLEEKMKIDTEGVSISSNLNVDGSFSIAQTGQNREGVISNNDFGDVLFVTSASDVGSGGQLILQSSRGTTLNPTQVLSGDRIATSRTRAFGPKPNGTGFFECIEVDVRALENITDTNRGASWALSTANIGSSGVSQKILCDPSGVKFNNEYYMPLTDGDAGSVLTTDGSGQTSWVGKSFSETSLSANTTVTPLSQDTWTAVSGSFTAGLSSSDWTPSLTSEMTYTGTVSKTFKVDISASWECEQKDSECAISVFKNTNIISSTEQHGSLDDNGKYPRNVSTSGLLNATNGDTVTIRVKNIENSGGVTLQWCSFTVTEV